MYSTQLHTSHQHLHLTPPHYRYIQHWVTQISPKATPNSTSLPLDTALNYTHPTKVYTSIHLTIARYSTQLHTVHQNLHLSPPHCCYIQRSVTHIPPRHTPHSTSKPLYTTLSYTYSTNKYTSIKLTKAIQSTHLHTSHEKLQLTPPHWR